MRIRIQGFEMYADPDTWLEFFFFQNKSYKKKLTFLFFQLRIRKQDLMQIRILCGSGSNAYQDPMQIIIQCGSSGSVNCGSRCWSGSRGSKSSDQMRIRIRHPGYEKLSINHLIVAVALWAVTPGLPTLLSFICQAMQRLSSNWIDIVSENYRIGLQNKDACIIVVCLAVRPAIPYILEDYVLQSWKVIIRGCFIHLITVHFVYFHIFYFIFKIIISCWCRKLKYSNDRKDLKTRVFGSVVNP
jgi:hypothetical protein